MNRLPLVVIAAQELCRICWKGSLEDVEQWENLNCEPFDGAVEQTIVWCEDAGHPDLATQLHAAFAELTN